MQRELRTIVAWWKRLGLDRPRLIDVGLAIVVAVATIAAISVARETGSTPPDRIAYGLAMMIGALVLARRRWPMGVLIASVVMMQIYYYPGNYPGISAAMPLAVALYTAAAAGHLRWALAVAAWYWVIPLVFAIVGVLGPQIPVLNDLVRDGSLLAAALFAVLAYPEPLVVALGDTVRDGALLVAVLLLGDGVRSHRALESESAARLRRAEADRAREAQELRAARVIQQQLLPKTVPTLPGWHLADYYQPARAVGGDFYDFLTLGDGQVALITGDATDKGIPAALIMATTHTILRGAAPGETSPGVVLQRANDRLYLDTPANMFVTCLYLVLDPASGRLRYANAGHNLPYVATAAGVRELRATGMPLGAMPDMTYEEQEAYLAPGDSLLLHSDGLVEAHSPTGEMFGFPRLRAVVAQNGGDDHLIDACLTALRRFVGHDWEQEDDITLVTLQRAAARDALSGRITDKGGG